MATPPTRGGLVIVELVRLAVVVVLTAAGFSLGPAAAGIVDNGDPDRSRLVTSVLGALVGYLLGGALGRQVVHGVDRAQDRLSHIDSAILVSSVIGGTLAALLGIVLAAPLLFLPSRAVAILVAIVLVTTLAYAGGRLGASRGGDLSRYIGVRGRLEVKSPSRGAGTKMLDSSALVDGRLVEVARAGFLEGTLVVPVFVLHEVQAMADSEDRRRRDLARRGLDALKTLQEEGLVAIEISEEIVPEHRDVDAKLAALCRKRQAAMVTVDANLARVAEVSGVRVLNLHALADSLRPPVIPGDRIELRLVKQGTEPAQGVGYLADGTMVVVEKGADHIGGAVTADVTSIMQNRQGRMLFATLADGVDA
ncbi:MAG: hypothetical protein KY457_06110 [Actinobacteria bacterium]|nr:hypothetical protein [Actinomycetota bacterium]